MGASLLRKTYEHLFGPHMSSALDRIEDREAAAFANKDCWALPSSHSAPWTLPARLRCAIIAEGGTVTPGSAMNVVKPI